MEGGESSVSFLCQSALGIFTALQMRVLCADRRLATTQNLILSQLQEINSVSVIILTESDNRQINGHFIEPHEKKNQTLAVFVRCDFNSITRVNV